MATQLLNDDGTASMATMIMSSHHAFRRDLACFAESLAQARPADAMQEEWASYHGALHGHHTIEDTAMFPDLRTRFPAVAGALDELDAQHRAIDPLLQRGDRAFAGLPASIAEAREVVAELQRHLAAHLDLEERVVIPLMRTAKEFPAPPSEEALAMYADGFAWSTAGLAPNVVTQIHAMLPEGLVAKLPAARKAFEARCLRIWGHGHADVSETSVPGPLPVTAGR